MGGPDGEELVEYVDGWRNVLDASAGTCCGLPVQAEPGGAVPAERVPPEREVAILASAGEANPGHG